jgi:hypothetical protein
MKMRVHQVQVAVWLATLRATAWISARSAALQDRDESGSPTLETVVIAAGLLAIAIAAVLIIKTAVSHYSAQIQ